MMARWVSTIFPGPREAGMYLVAFQRGIVFSVIVATDDTFLRGIEIRRMSR